MYLVLSWYIRFALDTVCVSLFSNCLFHLTTTKHTIYRWLSTMPQYSSMYVMCAQGENKNRINNHYERTNFTANYIHTHWTFYQLNSISMLFFCLLLLFLLFCELTAVVLYPPHQYKRFNVNIRIIYVHRLFLFLVFHAWVGSTIHLIKLNDEKMNISWNQIQICLKYMQTKGHFERIDI